MVQILDLGTQALTGIFPKTRSETVPAGPLELYKCSGCDLVQLGHDYDLSKLYGETYGYRSGLNKSMVRHLQQKVANLLRLVRLESGDLVVDIGSNDSTLLQAYPKEGVTLVGIDPSGPKFRKYYPAHVQLIPEFFSADLIRAQFPGRRVKIVTSIAMFYDLEHPMDFVAGIAGILDDAGVWVFEQSYLPAMLRTHSYDTVCHEHLEYYALKQVKRMLDQAGLKIVALEFNDVNGGSFAVTAARRAAPYPEATDLVNRVLADEDSLGLSGEAVYAAFRSDVVSHRRDLKTLLRRLREDGKKVLGYGASTKGNVLIQFCGIDTSDVAAIAEVNEDKFGAFTPASRLPIVSEADARRMKPDYFLVFPWHFRENIIQRERAFLDEGGRLVFPLPRIEIVTRDGTVSPDRLG